jgi:hypothetical protein
MRGVQFFIEFSPTHSFIGVGELLSLICREIKQLAGFVALLLFAV